MSDRKSGNSNIPNSAIAVGVAAVVAAGGLVYHLLTRKSEEPNSHALHGGAMNMPGWGAAVPPRQYQEYHDTNAPIPITTRKSETASKQVERENIFTCAICLDDLFSEDPDASCPVEIPCNHYFHIACVMEWSETNRSCPMCSAKIPADLKTVYF